MEEYYETCEFIHDYMQFYSYPDFLDHRDELINQFQKSDRIYKLMYQWYIWSHDNISKEKKERIWNMLNQNYWLEEEFDIEE